ncbi:MAG: 16S rRNA (adenine(1518)-N(6)/adenine(1519)-N(6))-dimethyltransferase RsmA [Nitrospirales bacterium]|nr:16S rRNA (adenine(1518)-N(6)/adenine(1519)-N(6))-dimethyltransferase RsmA [Nitrospirales bacterium]
MKPETRNFWNSPPLPRKALGQHFLIDPNIIKKIIHLADLHPDESVMEIGPGRGILTAALCQKVTKVWAIETDRRMVDYLTHALAHSSNLEVIHGDALKFPYATLPPGTVIVANLPYNISTPLLFQFLDARAHIRRMVLTLQLEVARRLVAPVGTRDYGVLSVLLQYIADVRLAFQVPNSCFRPSPKVDSAVVRIDVRRSEAIADAEAKLFGQIVRAAFSHRRKILSNSMRDSGFPPHEIQLAFSQANIDAKRRAETLTVKEFTTLTHAMLKVRGSC